MNKTIKSIEHFEVPDEVSFFLPSCFNDSKKLKSIEIPQNVYEIYMSSFHDCKSFVNICMNDLQK